MVGLTTLLVGVALLVAQIVVIEQLRRQRKETDRVHGLYRALAKDLAELRGDVPPLREHVLREAGVKPPIPGNTMEQAKYAAKAQKATVMTGPIQPIPNGPVPRYVESYDDELNEALKQCAVEE